MGAFAYELKQLAKGKKTTDFESLDNGMKTQYVMNNMLHGGGLGFLADILFGSRYGGAEGLATSIIGPVPMLAAKAVDLTFGNFYRFMSGETVNIGGQTSDFIKKNFPGGSAWYMRLALERYIFDFLEELMDPKYMEKRRRKEKRIYKKEGTEYWWSPGNKIPESSPIR